MYIKANIKTIIERIIEKFEGYIDTVEEDFENDEIILKVYDTDFLDDIINEEKDWAACEQLSFEFSEEDEDDLFNIVKQNTELFHDYELLPLTINSMEQTINELKKVIA